MKTTIQKLIDEGILSHWCTRESGQDRIGMYNVSPGTILAYTSQPHAASIIDHVHVTYNDFDDGIDYVDCEVFSMAGEPHTKYFGINSEIEIKIFHESG